MPYQDDISKITNFAPYIETTPIRTLEIAGAQRQQQYNEGLQLIQQTNQQTKDLGSMFYDPKQKEYLNTKLSSIQNQLSGAIAGDLSNQGLVTSIGGAIKSVTNDDIIKQAITDSGRIKSGFDLQKKLQDEGKAHVNNDNYYQSQLQEYLAKPLTDESGRPKSFNGEYLPYTDYDKKLREIAEKLRSNTKKQQNDNPYRDRITGAYTNSPANADIADAMQRKVFEGIDPAELRLALETNLDDNDRRQLNIDGWAKYRGYDLSQMQEVATNHFKNEHKQDYNLLNQLKLVRGTLDPKDFPKIDNKIAQVEASLVAAKEKYDKSLNLSNDNLEQFKQYIYKDEHLAGLSNAYSNLSETTQIINSPIKDVQLRNRDYELAVSKFNIDKKFQALNYQLSAANISSEIESRELTNALKAKELGIPVDLSKYKNALKLDTSMSLPESPAEVDARLAAVILEADATNANNKIKEIKNEAFANWQPPVEDLKKSPFESDADFKNKKTRLFEEKFNQGIAIFSTGSKKDIETWTNNGNQMIAPYIKQHIEQEKTRNAAVNLIASTKAEINSNPVYKKKVLNDNKVTFTNYVGEKNGKPVYETKQLSPLDIKTALDNGKATIFADKAGNYRLDYNDGIKFTYDLPKAGFFGSDKIGGKETRAVLSSLHNYLLQNKETIAQKDKDYTTALKAKIYGAKPTMDAILNDNGRTVQYINNVIVDAQKGEGQHSLSPANKAFDADKALAIAADPKHLTSYKSIGDNVYVSITSTDGKTKGETQTFDMTKDKFIERYGIVPKELPSYFTITKALGTTNYNTKEVSTLNQAVNNPALAVKTAWFTSALDFPGVTKYKIAGDFFYKKGSTSETIPVIYVTDPRTNQLRAISAANFTDPNSGDNQFRTLTDANIDAMLKQ